MINLQTVQLGIDKETTLERADFTRQLLMFETAEKERGIFIISRLSVVCHLFPHIFRLRQAERVQTMKALTNRPRSQLFLI